MGLLKKVGIGLGVVALGFVVLIVIGAVYYSTLDYQDMDCDQLTLELEFERDMLPYYTMGQDLEGVERWNEVRSIHKSKCQ